MTLEHAFVPRGHDQVGDLGREEPAEAAQALELLDLGLNASLERVIPFGQLRGLTLDGVVISLDPQQ